MTPPVRIACVSAEPWALEVLVRRHPGLPVAVLSEGARRVEQADRRALAAGVTPGMRESAALSRCPELHAEVLGGPVLAASWRELLELLYSRFSDRIEGRRPGLAFLQLPVRRAQELAALLHLPVGAGASQEVAHLAALRARPGEVREITPETEDALLAVTPLPHLQALGLTTAQVNGLQFLGLRCLGDLLAWKPAQRAAFLGAAQGTQLGRFARGTGRATAVARWTPGETVEGRVRPDAPLEEPGQVEAALSDLVPGLFGQLRARTAAYLSVTAETLGGQLSATRRPKGPLDAAGLLRTALLALHDTQALPLGIEALTVTLSGFSQPSRQAGLWPDARELGAVSGVLGRFPDALVRVVWKDRHAYVHDAQYVWADWLTGEERRTPMTPEALSPARAEPAPTTAQTTARGAALTTALTTARPTARVAARTVIQPVMQGPE